MSAVITPPPVAVWHWQPADRNQNSHALPPFCTGRLTIKRGTQCLQVLSSCFPGRRRCSRHPSLLFVWLAHSLRFRYVVLFPVRFWPGTCALGGMAACGPSPHHSCSSLLSSCTPPVVTFLLSSAPVRCIAPSPGSRRSSFSVFGS